MSIISQIAGCANPLALGPYMQFVVSCSATCPCSNMSPQGYQGAGRIALGKAARSHRSPGLVLKMVTLLGLCSLPLVDSGYQSSPQTGPQVRFMRCNNLWECFPVQTTVASGRTGTMQKAPAFIYSSPLRTQSTSLIAQSP